MSFPFNGTVYGPLLNFRRELGLALPLAGAAPYKAAPKAPVLYIKTANTWSAGGSTIAVPARLASVELGATLGLVIGRALHRPTPEQAWASVAGLVLMNDLSVPHSVQAQGFYRPPVKYKCLDGFLGVGSTMRPAGSAQDLAALQIQLRVNGDLVQTIDLKNMVRPAPQLLADVGEFMTLQPGDVLMLGLDCLEGGTRPLARAGDRIEISAPGFEPLFNRLTGEAA